MATVGTVTVEVTPVLPKDATEQIETAVRAAIAEALRNLADGLVTEAKEAVKEARFSLYTEPSGKGWAVRDRANPTVEARFHAEWATHLDAQEAVADLSERPRSFSDYDWDKIERPWVL